MSRAIFDAPITLPSSSLISATLSDTATRRPVRSHPLRLEVLDAPTLLECLDDAVFFCEAVRRNHERDVAANGVGGRVAEQALGSRIPALDEAVEPLADDRDLREDSTIDASRRAVSSWLCFSRLDLPSAP